MPANESSELTPGRSLYFGYIRVFASLLIIYSTRNKNGCTGKIKAIEKGVRNDL